MGWDGAELILGLSRLEGRVGLIYRMIGQGGGISHFRLGWIERVEGILGLLGEGVLRDSLWAWFSGFGVI